MFSAKDYRLIHASVPVFRAKNWSFLAELLCNSREQLKIEKFCFVFYMVLCVIWSEAGIRNSFCNSTIITGMINMNKQVLEYDYEIPHQHQTAGRSDTHQSGCMGHRKAWVGKYGWRQTLRQWGRMFDKIVIYLIASFRMHWKWAPRLW